MYIFASQDASLRGKKAPPPRARRTRSKSHVREAGASGQGGGELLHARVRRPKDERRGHGPKVTKAEPRRTLLFHGSTRGKKNNLLRVLLNIHNVLPRGVTQDLFLGEDSGRAGHLPGAGVNRSLWALRCVFSAPDIFAGRVCVFSSFRLPWQNYGTSSTPHFFKKQQRFSFFDGFLTGASAFC